MSALAKDEIHPEAKYWRDRFYAAEQEIEEMRERYAQLNSLLMGDEPWLDLGITGAQLTMLKVLYKRELATKEQLYHALYGDRVNEFPDQKIIDVQICKMRKLLPAGTVLTAWGRGYHLSPEGREWLRAKAEKAQ